MNQQLQTGKMEMPSIASTLRDSGAGDITLEEHNAEREQEEETGNELSMIEQGVLTLAKVSVHELPRGTYALEELNAEREQEEETENEISIGHNFIKQSFRYKLLSLSFLDHYLFKWQ